MHFNIHLNKDHKKYLLWYLISYNLIGAFKVIFKFIDAVPDTKQFLCSNSKYLYPTLKTPQNLNYKQDIIQIPFLKNSLHHWPFVKHMYWEIMRDMNIGVYFWNVLPSTNERKAMKCEAMSLVVTIYQVMEPNEWSVWETCWNRQGGFNHVFKFLNTMKMN